MSAPGIFKAQLIAKTVTGSISLFFSSLIVFMILYASDGLQSSYSRIIFFLSIGDIIFSSTIIMAPHLLPKNEPSGIWAKGNVASCDGMGFLLHTGMALNQLYTVALSYYFLKRVKDQVKPPEFAKRYEKLIHAAIWIVAVVLNLIALFREDFNPVESGDLCAMIDKPIDCSLKDDMECIRGENANKDAFFLVVSIIFVVFTLIVSNFARLTNYVYKAEMLMRMEKAEQNLRAGPGEDTAVKYNFCKEVTKYLCGCCFRTSGEDEEQPEKESPSLAFESFVQSGLWISIFLLVYIPPTLAFGLKAMGLTHRPTWLFWFPSLTTPLGGALNIIVYTRPKIHKMRRLFPELEESPYFFLFLIVVFSGGECPKEIDFLNLSEEEEEGSRSKGKKNSSPEGREQDDSFMDDDISYERYIQDLLGESVISTDSFLNFFYAKNPVKDSKSRARKFSSENGTPDDSNDGCSLEDESRINNVSYVPKEESLQHYSNPARCGNEIAEFEI